MMIPTTCWVVLLLGLVGATQDECSKPQYDCDFCDELWKDTVQGLLLGTKEEFYSLASPYFDGAQIAYNWRKDQSLAIPGWTFLHQRYPMLDGEYGMHALAFQSNDNPHKVMIAFRGAWDKGLTPEVESDFCAAQYLMKFVDSIPFCVGYTVQEMNYYSMALDFVTEVRALPVFSEDSKVCFGFTGHSLGSLLSFMMSMTFDGKMPAIAFSGPGAQYAAQLVGLEVTQENTKNIINTRTEFDPIVLIEPFYSNQTGWDCNIDKPAQGFTDCDRCFETNNFVLFDMTNPCFKCFLREHSLMTDIITYFINPRFRPMCSKYAYNV